VVIHASAELEKTYYNNQRSFVIRCSVTVVILYIVLKATPDSRTSNYSTIWQ
jgi:hypothetical protein